METTKLTEKKKTENFIYGLVTFVVAYVIYKYFTRILGIDYSLREGININLVLDLGIFVACYLIIKFVIDKLRK